MKIAGVCTKFKMKMAKGLLFVLLRPKNTGVGRLGPRARGVEAAGEAV